MPHQRHIKFYAKKKKNQVLFYLKNQFGNIGYWILPARARAFLSLAKPQRNAAGAVIFLRRSRLCALRKAPRLGERFVPRRWMSSCVAIRALKLHCLVPCPKITGMDGFIMEKHNGKMTHEKATRWRRYLPLGLFLMLPLRKTKASADLT